MFPECGNSSRLINVWANMLYDMSVNESLLCNELEAGIGRHVLNCGVIEPVNQNPTMACQTSQNISIADSMSILLAARIIHRFHASLRYHVWRAFCGLNDYIIVSAHGLFHTIHNGQSRVTNLLNCS
jgi:hypothetical protein